LYPAQLAAGRIVARLRFDEGDEVKMKPGDFINIPAHNRHRVEWTTPDKPTIWRFSTIMKGERVMLLAQFAAPDTTSFWLIGVVLGVALLIGFVFFMVLLFRYLRSSRQLTHTERMRSLEAGFPLEAPVAPEETESHQAKFMHNAFWISFWLVSSVPAAALSAASAGTKTVDGSIALSIVVWIGAALASVAAVVCATVLMLNSRGHRADNSDGLRKTTKPM
jgi:hypothetical protein